MGWFSNLRFGVSKEGTKVTTKNKKVEWYEIEKTVYANGDKTFTVIWCEISSEGYTTKLSIKTVNNLDDARSYIDSKTVVSREIIE